CESHRSISGIYSERIVASRTVYRCSEDTVDTGIRAGRVSKHMGSPAKNKTYGQQNSMFNLHSNCSLARIRRPIALFHFAATISLVHSQSLVGFDQPVTVFRVQK